ncbi:hypothetical protein F4820DRAFT_443772 [Hypoxylon rubiginosum]|uniref:Uncharacterized protein n=1 Tax=Hypoxylon rubiginosum TaxID=110542 RepID=A0ACB9ZD09_9PEZI|nr:hypothetical protein F4820DRAFT_443772 [Hypoxylon rubiginosum]
MKLLAIALSSCLWPLASSHPAPVPINRIGHAIDTVPVTHKDAHFSRATRFAGIPPAAAAAAVPRDATAAPLVAPGSNFTAAGNRTGAIRCAAGGSSFVDATVPDSAPAADCLAIADGLAHAAAADDAQFSGYWQYGAADAARRNVTGTKLLASHGACAFGVVAGDGMTAASVPIGTEDAATVIRLAVKKFASGNGTAMASGTNGTNGTNSGMGSGPRLGAAGAFQCGVGPSTMVNWAIYHAM